MEKSFSTYRDVIDTSAEDSDDLFLDDSDTKFRQSLPSSTIVFPQRKDSLPLPKGYRETIEETDDEEDEDDEPLVILKKTTKKKNLIDSDSEEEIFQDNSSDGQSSTSPQPQNDDSQFEEEDSQALQIDETYNAENDEQEQTEDSHSDGEEEILQENSSQISNIDSSKNDSGNNNSRQKRQASLLSDKSLLLEEISNSNKRENVSKSKDEDSIQKTASADSEQNKSIQESILLSSMEDLSENADVVDVSSGAETDDVTFVSSVQPPKPSTPKFIQSKITSMLTPTKKVQPSSSMPLSAIPSGSSSLGNINFAPPPGKKFVPKTDYINQQNRVAMLQQNLHQTQNALTTLDLETLPDRGQVLKNREMSIINELAAQKHKLSTMLIEPKTQPEDKANADKVYGLSWQELRALSNQVQPAGLGGKQAMQTYHEQKTLTMDRLKTLHQSLQSKPKADVMEDDPKMLKAELMPHQKHALAFLLWRESQRPAGGILADDMGLGKTLTMISLILKTKELAENDENKMKSESEESSDDENEEEKERKRRREYYPGGTLVICPASLINQWENEIRRHCRRDALSVNLYHGPNREFKPRRLAKHDVVITTYNLAGLDKDKSSGIFSVRWKRIILDEAHIIRNAKANCSIGVCALEGKKRWCLTGTPVQNKELDLYALLKFLKCSPFNDLQIWKKWIDNKQAGGQDRLNTVIQSLMLRRTKQQLQDNGTISSLPDKSIELIKVVLSKDEMNIYQKILIFSKTLFAQFLHQRLEKNADLAYSAGTQARFLNGNPNPEYEKVHQKLLKMHGTGEVKTAQILVLLLRLRQTCCHVGLIKSMIENEEACSVDGVDDTEGNDIDLLAQLEKLGINDDEEHPVDSSGTENVDGAPAPESAGGETLNAAASKLINSNNPIFKTDKASSKVNMVIDTLKRTALAQGDKAIVVSQWTSMLKIVEEHLAKQGIKCATLDGKVPVNKRMALVDDFNRQSSSLKILLLSLTAGGVGLNLIGANHLLLIDLHWNPQLESQAQDRIYRFGQKKDVCIYKFVTADTIEERIKALQERKLEMAENLLTGTKQAGNKLTIEDLKMLFSM